MPEEPEAGIRVTCESHGEAETFEPGYWTVAFHCDGSGIEVEVHLQNTEDWRELTELC